MQNSIRTFHRTVFTRFLLILALCPALFALRPAAAQVPQGFNYQAIARDGSGNPIVGATIKVKLSLLTDTLGFRAGTGGTYLWEEEHTGVVTNAFGLFTIVLGNPSATRIQGVASFSVIDWNKPTIYIGTKIANPTTYKVLGGAKLWSVPYALVSGNISGPVKKLKVTSLNTSPDSAIFEVKNNTGQTVFAVYNEGVRVYVDDGIAKGVKGGFAIGGFGTDKAASKSYFMVSPDSIRAYIAPSTGKAVKGGFAIGGFDPAKTFAGEEYLRVTRDSTRVYIKEQAKGVKGGFAIGGFDNTKGIVREYLHVTPDSTRIFTSDTISGFGVGDISGGKTVSYLKLSPFNYFIGHQSGENIQIPEDPFIGRYNSTIGYQAGMSLTTGSRNVLIGHQSGMSITNGDCNTAIGPYTLLSGGGSDNTAIGTYALSSTFGSNNTAIGTVALYLNTYGQDNTAVGFCALRYNTIGICNVAIGSSALIRNTTGGANTATGVSAMASNTTGGANTATGVFALAFNTIGGNNTAFGYGSLVNNTTGNDNTAVGVYALKSNTTGNYNSAFGDSATVSAGALTNATAIGYKAVVNASNKVRIGNSSVTVIEGQVNWSVASDSRLKNNIQYSDQLGLEFVNNLKTATFTYKNDIIKKHHDGLIAQDVRKTLDDLGLEFSGLVESDNDQKTLNLSYAEFVIPLINSVKKLSNQSQEQQQQIETQQKELNELKVLVNTLVANQAGKGNK